MAAQKKIEHKRGVLNTVGATTATVDIAIPTDSVVSYEARFVLHDTSSGNEDGGLKQMEGVSNNNSGTVTIIGAVFNNFVSSASLAACTVAASVSTTNVRFTVTGVAGVTIDWQYEIRYITN